MDPSSYLPSWDPESDSFVHQDLGIMQKNTRQMFYQFTRTIDKLLQKRLLSLNHFSSSFLSSVIEQLRITLQSEHQIQTETGNGLEKQINKVETILANQRHQPELMGVYVVLAVVLGVNFLIFFGMQLLRNSIVNWLMHYQLKYARL